MNENEARRMKERLAAEGFTVEVVHVPDRGEWHVVVEDGDVTWKCDPEEQTWRPIAEIEPVGQPPEHRMREQLYRAVWG